LAEYLDQTGVHQGAEAIGVAHLLIPVPSQVRTFEPSILPGRRFLSGRCFLAAATDHLE
jgi:hypothetical protein